MVRIVPKVSVIVPVYNAEKYLEECLDSIINQTFQDIEIICVDDGSKDLSLKILDKFAEKDKRILIFKQKNKGAACARNFGLSKSKGMYVIFLDSDDIFELNMIEKAVAKADEYKVDIVVWRANIFDTTNYRKAKLNDRFLKLKKYQNKVFSVNDIPNEIFNSFLLQVWNKLFKKSFLLENNIQFQNIKRSNDLVFTCKGLCLAKKIILLNEYLINYRSGMQNNLQSGNDNSPLCFYEALSELKKYLVNNGLYITVEKSFLQLSLDVIFYNLNTLRNLETFKYVAFKIREQGFDILGITKYPNLRDLSFTGYLQYQYIKIGNNRLVLKYLFFMHKLIEYYQFTGLKNTVRKVILKF